MFKTYIIGVWVAFFLFASACQQNNSSTENTMEKPTSATPPVATIVPKEIETHGHKRTDNYFWLREKENPQTISYLNAENAYVDTMMAHTKGFQEKLFDEMKARIKEDDSSVPYLLKNFWYYTRFETGKEYPIFCRKYGNLNAKEEILLDCNAEAEGKPYYNAAGLEISDNNELMAYSEDVVSRRRYTLKFRNLKTGKNYPETIEDTQGGDIAWAADNKTVFYIKMDTTTLLGYQVWRHELGTDVAKDVLVYEEKDNSYYMGVGRVKSGKFVMIYCSSTMQDEARIVEANYPNGQFKLFLPREKEHKYSIDHAENKFYVRTNWEAKNFRLMEVEDNKIGNKNAWKDLVPHKNDVLIEDFSVFKDFLVFEARKGGLTQINIRKWAGNVEHAINFGEPTYSANLGYNPQYETKALRYGYNSMTTPASTYDYNMETRQKELKKQQEVVGGKFKTENYITERIEATAADGTKVPMSVVYKIGTPLDGTSPLLQYGYGSYGASMEATFSSNRLSLLDRGFIYVICHIRGGQEMGRQWYEDGKLLKKKNTFTDFIACSEHLIKNKYTNKDKLFAFGGSAGGLLMGAVVNMRPDLYKGVVAAVPFVDVISTMLDETIPLTTNEFDEWGNPKNKEYYDYMLSYSPYDNVEKKQYPNMLITTGLHDSQVQYWEPAKWIAKLRAMKTDKNKLMLKTNMEAGHGGASGRFQYLKEVALQYAFMIDLANIPQIETEKTKQ